jgi:hypothetical protein
MMDDYCPVDFTRSVAGALTFSFGAVKFQTVDVQSCRLYSSPVFNFYRLRE